MLISYRESFTGQKNLLMLFPPERGSQRADLAQNVDPFFRQMLKIPFFKPSVNCAELELAVRSLFSCQTKNLRHGGEGKSQSRISAGSCPSFFWMFSVKRSIPFSWT
jgi:hypothetical protein